MRILLFLLAGLLLTTRVQAQGSDVLFEDKNGETAITSATGGGSFRLNTADASLKAAFVNRTAAKKLFYGFDLSGKTADGLLPLFADQRIAPGARFNAIVGLQELGAKDSDHDLWLFARLGYEVTKLKTLRTDLPYSSQIAQKNFAGLNGSVVLNYKYSTFLGGLALYHKKTNNYADLPLVKVTDQVTSTDPVTGSTRTVDRSYDIKQGMLISDSNTSIRLDGYMYFGEQNRVGMYGYIKTATNAFAHPSTGLGLYLLKKDNPLQAIAGIVTESHLLDNVSKTLVVSIITGYTFSKAP